MTKKNQRKSLSMTALFVPEIRALLNKKSFSDVKFLVSKIPSIDLAERWHNFSDQEKILKSVVDVIGLIIYFKAAQLILPVLR
ncbi:MAG: hypothetical protein V1739_04910 [Candidatus Omnitrophota bacterium]